MPNIDKNIDTVRASRDGHTFHERWTARRALQLVVPNDDLFAIAVEGISSTETVSPGKRAEEVADLVLYYGVGDNFLSCKRLETIQFKYKFREEVVTAVYLKKTIEKFSDTILGYEKSFSLTEVASKLAFIFVTNAEFSEELWDAIKSITGGTKTSTPGAAIQARNLKKWCSSRGLADASRLFLRMGFRAGEKSLAGQESALRRTLTDWSAGADSEARLRVQGLQELVQKKAGLRGQGKNLIRREDVLDALECEPSDLFPADTQFIDVGSVVARAELSTVSELVKTSKIPVFIHAEGGVGKTVFIQSLAARMEPEFDVVVFDCFGGGSYRSDNHSRHLPSIGLVQIVNELASRTLCDPMLPSGDDSRKIIRAACRRLTQAVKAIRAQSDKLGVVVIVDAADNAQVEADYRHEQAFPKLFLSAIGEDPIEGVKLILTARTHRKANVIGRTSVEEIELGPFSNPEAREFLKARKSHATSVEIATALARSNCNARVLDYLVQTWKKNVLGKTSDTPITVPEIIAQRCAKIVSDLHVAGWPDSEVTEFFVALSLLPPPIPLNELANALGWSAAQVNTAASDLAPMLEITSHGAIFRDEPTETYVRETYASEGKAQRLIADRLLSSQTMSTYAAEALPHFLVIIQDSDRAFALADSADFPMSIQSEFGRRRLTLERLRAAFRLAVTEIDFDRILSLSMRLAQVTTANMRGNEFIRTAPALAVVLGDADSYRRLFADRTGWRGARSARLAIAYRFAGEIKEAQIQCDSAVRWTNWYVEESHDDTSLDRSGPGAADYAAVLFQHVMENDYDAVDSNLVRWNESFSLSACSGLLQLVQLFDQANRSTVFTELALFAASDRCSSRALKLALLSRPFYLDKRQVKALAKMLSKPASAEEEEHLFRPDQGKSDDIVYAALTTLLYSSRAAAASILRDAPLTRLSAYHYSERHGSASVWLPILSASVRAWSSGRRVAHYDLLPNDIKISREAKAITTEAALITFLKGLREAVPRGTHKRGEKKLLKARFGDRECEEIGKSIGLARDLIAPIELAVLSSNGISSESMASFLDTWNRHLRNGMHWRSESAVDLHARAIGLGCVRILLDHTPQISTDQAAQLIGLISSGRFFVPSKIDLLGQLARRPVLHTLAGEFAQHVAEQIRQDDNIEQRGNSYLKLAGSLVPMGVGEAREYYRQGLAQLDQMGGESYEQIYSLLHFASAQRGGLLKPALAQRLMNLCQAILRDEPRKFGWTLLARAAAKSMGLPAIAKLIRWHDQDVADMSYGLPQLACFLSKNGYLDPRRAAFILTICEDHGWWDWRSGDGVADLLALADPSDHRRLFKAVTEKLRSDHPFTAWPSLWQSFLETSNQYPKAITSDDREGIERLRAEAQLKQDEFNNRNSPLSDIQTIQVQTPSKQEIDSFLAALVANCDVTSASSIDQSLKIIDAKDNFPYTFRQSFLVELRANCPYSKRLDHLFAVCDAVELNLSQSLEILTECFNTWSRSSTHLATNAKELITQLFESKSSELFEDKYSSISRKIRLLSDFCSDTRFVLQLILRKVASNEVVLDGDEWLQLATALCDVTSEEAGLAALELLLSGPTSRIADEIGEGAFRIEQALDGGEVEFFSDFIWHVLGQDDSYIRWTVARGLKTLLELGLNEELGLLLDRFDQREVISLASKDKRLSFQNSQQWLLMGLARAALSHGQSMVGLRPKLLALAKRDDLHVIDKINIARCLRNINSVDVPDTDLEALRKETDYPAHGIVISDIYSTETKPTSDFRFDYDFAKSDISSLAYLFNIPQASVEDLMAAEIVRRWPEVTSLNQFPGHDRYQRDSSDRYELYREHIQRHALLNAATSLSKTLPLVIRSYETGGESPWLEWLRRYDITFDDGSWLSDHKDPVPQQAKESLLGKRIGQQETLQDQNTLLHKLGLLGGSADALLPIYGEWTSTDGVGVRITSALTERKGVIGRCTEFANLPEHDFWLPEFWDAGYYDQRRRNKNIFSPLVWAPETHNIGIDVGEKISASGPIGRPRLGIDLTKQLALVNAPRSDVWQTADGRLALRSQVWGSWIPDPDHSRYRQHANGEILWASPDWLAMALAVLNQRIVFTVKLWKYRSSHSYDVTGGVKSTLLALRRGDGTLRLWQAKNASKQKH